MKLERARESSFEQHGKLRTIDQPFTLLPSRGVFFSHCIGRRLELRISAARVSVEDPDELAGPLER